MFFFLGISLNTQTDAGNDDFILGNDACNRSAKTDNDCDYVFSMTTRQPFGSGGRTAANLCAHSQNDRGKKRTHIDDAQNKKLQFYFHYISRREFVAESMAGKELFFPALGE